MQSHLRLPPSPYLIRPVVVPPHNSPVLEGFVYNGGTLDILNVSSHQQSHPRLQSDIQVYEVDGMWSV